MSQLTTLNAVLLGLIQGLTEFLPVSSSGHLAIFQTLFGISGDKSAILALDVMLHLGTLLAVVMVFYRDIANMIFGRAWRLFGLLALATLPVAILGIPLKSSIESAFGSLFVVGVSLMVTGLILWVTQFILLTHSKKIGFKESFFIGVAQVLALFPGISRSGITIAAGLFQKVDRNDAARFSFLMSIPAIIGAAIVQIPHLAHISPTIMGPILAGTVTSAIVGYGAIKWMLRIIQKGELKWFGLYCGVAGLASVVLSQYL